MLLFACARAGSTGMRAMRRITTGLIAGVIALGACPVVAESQTYPTRPLIFLIPFGAGGTIDTQLRALAMATAKYFGQPIVIENRPSANGLLAATHVAAAPPEDYTVTQIHPGVLRQPFITKTPYDPTTDFTYIIGISAVTSGLVVRSDAPWKDFRAFLADARANPGKITYGSPGGALNPHVVMEKIAEEQGIQWTHVPFRSFAESSNALLGGHIHAVSDTAGWAPLVNSGRLRLLVTYDERRTKNWPEVPALAEFGIGIATNTAYGLAGPKGMSPGAVRILHDAFKQGMHEPSFLAVLKAFSQEPVYQSTEDYRAYIMRELAIQKRLVEELGLKDK
jgi:tripartite-type tricarboxylate transporter receptor subunit TctC